MSSREIAEVTGKRHDNIMRAIRELNDAQLLTPQSEELEFNHRGNKYKYWSLSKRDSYVVVARVSPQFTAALVDRWQLLEEKQLHSEIAEKVRQEARLEYRPMTDAIKSERESAGKEIKPYHFSNEADLINRIALGMTAAKFRVHHDLKKDAGIRDYITPEQLRCVTELQRANTVFIGMGWDFEKRKQELAAIFHRNHQQKLTDELARLEA